MSVLKKLAGQTAIYGLTGMIGRFLFFLLTPIYTNKEVFSHLILSYETQGFDRGVVGYTYGYC